MADTYYCPQCNQPMLPSKGEKVPSEYDHASGCPLSYAALSLEKQLAAALRDKERLEWVGETRSIVYENHESRWVCYVYRPNESGVYFWGDTMREAIDAAMSSSQPPAQEKESQAK